MSSAMKPIATMYRDTLMRSRFEANTARDLDRLHLAWQYEPHGFLLKTGEHYLPDFYIPELHLWIEVRGGDYIGGKELQFTREAAERADADYLVIYSPAQTNGHAPVIFFACASGDATDHLAALYFCRNCDGFFFAPCSEPLTEKVCRRCHARGTFRQGLWTVAGGLYLSEGRLSTTDGLALFDVVELALVAHTDWELA